MWRPQQQRRRGAPRIGRASGTNARAASGGWEVSSCCANSTKTGAGDAASSPPWASARTAEPEVLDHEPVELLDRVVFLGNPLPKVVRGGADRLLEERQEQLVLAAKILVEAAQGLPRPVDDLLNGEPFPSPFSMSSSAASRKRWTRPSARVRAESSDRATASSRQLTASVAALSSPDPFRHAGNLSRLGGEA